MLHWALIATLLTINVNIITPTIRGGHSSEPSRGPGRYQPGTAKRLDTYLHKFTTNPADESLRKTIIHFVAALDLRPEIPDEARRHFETAVGMMRAVTTSAGAELAITKYKEALILAHWWGEAYLLDSEALQQGRQYREAIQALRLYMLAEPQNAPEAQSRIHRLQGEQKVAALQDGKKSAVQSTNDAPHADAATKNESPDDALIRSLDGARYGWSSAAGNIRQSATFEIHGHRVLLRWEEGKPNKKGGPSVHLEQFPIMGRNFFRNSQAYCSVVFSGAQHCECKYTIESNAIYATVILEGREMPSSGAIYGICRGPAEIPRSDNH